MTPFSSVAILEKLALLKIALCKAPVFSNASSRRTSVMTSTMPTASPAGAAIASLLAMWFSLPNVVLPRGYPDNPCTRDANSSKQRVPAIEPGLDGLHQEQVCQGQQRNRTQQRQR